MASGSQSLLLDIGSGEGSGQNSENGAQQRNGSHGCGDQSGTGNSNIQVPDAETINGGLSETQITMGAVKLIRKCTVMKQLEKVPIKDSLFYAAAESLRQNSNIFDQDAEDLVQLLNFELKSGYTWGNEEAAALAERLGMGLVIVDDGMCYHLNVKLRIQDNL